jgi:polyphosphate glucokinase
MKRDKRRRRAQPKRGSPRTLAIDIGGTHVKASVLDRSGVEIVSHVEESTPRHAPPAVILALIDSLLKALPEFDRISVGFPGVVRHGRVMTAPNLGSAEWHNYPLAARLARRLRRPTRMLNDAEVQGLGVIEGKGLECVVTLGTGFGSAVYRDGELMPHLELGQHPIWKRKTYDQYLGAAAFADKGPKKWNRRVRRMIKSVRILLNYDRLYIGGGNAARINFELPPDVRIVSNEAGITGGVRLWEPRFDRVFR